MLSTVVVLTFPDRHSRCPEAVATEIPVGGGLDRLLETAVLDVLGEPINHGVVLLEHLGALAVDVHEPTGVGPINQLGATAVTVRVAVTDVINPPDNALLVQFLGDLFVGLPDLLALPRTAGVKTAVVEIEDKRKALGFGQGVVLFAVGRGQVDDAGAVFQRNVVGVPDLVGARSTVFEQRFVGLTDQFFPFKSA